jgi:3-hydroxyacyl-CoA dehydrogenase/enoyl-CoA hydratase/3-hydroxybutyryl-CoA epimerase
MNITRTLAPDGVCVLTFDRAGSSANIFDRATLDELDTHLGELEVVPNLRGVILASAKPKIFIAGADLNSFANADEATLGDLVDRGHRIFTRLGRLPVPSVAAINGICLGGGLEIALACDYRVASTDKSTKLGLPETQLGILPAWGGSVRLPKLIGLPAALGLILTGKQLVAAQALKTGVVDDVTHPEYLLEAARKQLARGKRRRTKAPGWMSRGPLISFVAAKARRDVMAKTRGHYPAPLKAIEVCARSVGEPIEYGLDLERSAFLELVRTPQCRSLMSVFFLQERAKKLSVREATPQPIKRVAVIGAGTMGAGIAQWVSARGLPVKMKDVSPEALARGMNSIHGVYTDAVKRRVFTVAEATAGMDRVTPIHVDVPMQDVDLVIEAALEKLDVKQDVFRRLESQVAPSAVLATNTSAISIDEIAGALQRPERLVGMHFFNPVHRMQLVEIVRGPRTSPAALATAVQFAKSIGKLPVIARDSPGFLVNRILLPYMVEAVWLFAEGVPAAEIDRLMLEFGMPMGPMRLCDEVGLDVAQHVAKDLERRLPQGVPINDTLEKMVANGWLGKKSGRGFYNHQAKGGRSVPNPDVAFLQGTTPRSHDAATRLDRMVLIMVNEAARVLAEEVVSSPEDVDFGMIMGTGWAPFRGGPLRYADARGIQEIVQRLDVLGRDIAPHFTPADYLRQLAQSGRGFYSPTPKPAATARVVANVDVPLVRPKPAKETARPGTLHETAGTK